MSNNSQRPDLEWRFFHPVTVEFADVDMFGHVNNARYLSYIESARVAYYAALSGITDPRDFGMTIASARIDFLRPIFFGQVVNVYCRIGRIGNKSWTLDHELRDSRSDDTLATASTVIVYYDYSTRSSVPIPAEIVEKMERFEGRSLRGIPA